MEKQIRRFIKKMPLWQQLIIIALMLGLTFYIQQNRVIDGDEVSLIACVDGDTATLSIGGEKEKVRFIAVDTPELSSKDYYAREAADFTCSALKKAEVIRLEYDPLADKRDKFGRVIAWVYVDEVLLQELLISGGYAKVRYIYNDYLYVGQLDRAEKIAKQNKIGVWAP